MLELSPIGYLTLALLVLCSVLVVAVGLDRLAFLSRNSLEPDWFQAQLAYFLKDNRADRCLAFVEHLGAPMARVAEVALHRRELPVATVEAALQTALAVQRRRFESGLPAVGTVAVIAPFIGLFGTVVGIMNTFAAVSEQGQAGVEVVSAGVAEALIATAAGLFVAISAVVLFNFLKSRVQAVAVDMTLAAGRLVEMLELLHKGLAFPADLTAGPEPDAARLFDEQVPGG